MDKQTILQALANSIRLGNMTIENVPEVYKEEVQEILNPQEAQE